MPEIAECYSIASKIPEIGEVNQIKFTKQFHKDINLKKNIKKDLIGVIIDKPFAYGKSIWFPLIKQDKVGFLVSQLGMTGSWSMNQRLDQRSEKHDHFTIVGSKGLAIYNDPRRFGKMNLFWGTDHSALQKEIIQKNKWGIDPFKSNEKKIALVLANGWKSRNQEIKKLLLEQNKIFGIGNYLASEILFKSKLDPHLKPIALNPPDYRSLAKAIKFIIHKALAAGGFSFAGGYLLPDGSYGDYANKVLIYGKEHCPVCKSKLIQEHISGRVTYWCKKCQKS